MESSEPAVFEDLTVEDLVERANPVWAVEIKANATKRLIKHAGAVVGMIVRQADEQDSRDFEDCREGALGKFALQHRRYSFPWEVDFGKTECSSLGELESRIREEYEVAAMSKVYLYDHSGLSFSLSPFSCPFDSGPLGVVFVTEGDWQYWRNCYVGRVPDDQLTAEHLLGNVFHHWKVVQEGDVDQMIVFDTSGSVVDERSGLYPYSDWAVRNLKCSAEQELQEMIDSNMDELRKRYVATAAGKVDDVLATTRSALDS